MVVAVDVYVETSVGRRCAGAPGRSSLFGPQERTRKTHGAPLGCCGTRGGWVGIGSRVSVSTFETPIRVHTSNPGGTKRNEHKGKTLAERTCRYMGGSELNWVFFPESMFCRYIRTGTGAGNLGIARRELQHTAEGRGPKGPPSSHVLSDNRNFVDAG